MAPSERPYVICHMTSSVDGRIKVRRWTTLDADDHYETIHKRLEVSSPTVIPGLAEGENPE